MPVDEMDLDHREHVGRLRGLVTQEGAQMPAEERRAERVAVVGARVALFLGADEDRLVRRTARLARSIRLARSLRLARPTARPARLPRAGARTSFTPMFRFRPCHRSIGCR